MRAEIDAELPDLRDEAARLAQYDLTLEGSRARAKLLALVERERELKALRAEAQS